MKVFRSLQEFRRGTNAVATIGTFDGVHLGHLRILERLREAAAEFQGESVVISFHPHPRLVLFPDDNPLRLLQTVDEKIARLELAGIDKLLLIPFTRDFSRLTSAEFIRTVLAETVGIRKIIIGYDHHFGRNRTGGLTDMMAGGTEHGFVVEEIPARQVDDANVSSTKIRHALHVGDVAQAARFLGYAYPLSGEVVHGEKLGRKLGFPTANLRISDPLKLIPADGVYVVNVHHQGQIHRGLASIGTRPTADGKELAVEAWLMDFDGDLYGETLTLEFLEWVRGQEKFASLELLVARMREDEQKARAYFGIN